MDKNTMIVVVLVTILFALIIMAIIGLYMISDDIVGVPETSSTLPPQTTVTSTISTTTSSVPTTSMPGEPDKTTTVPQIATTTTTIPLGVIHISIDPKNPYRKDDVYVTVDPDPHSEKKGLIKVNEKIIDTIGDDPFKLISLESGDYEVIVTMEGYEDSSYHFEVAQETYATSRDVRQKLSRGEELIAINEGKAVIRFYDTASCSICKAVVAQLNKVVDDNRECIVYEKLSYYKYSSRFGTGYLPFIEIEGKNGQMNANGQVKMSSIKNMVERVAGCDIQ